MRNRRLGRKLGVTTKHRKAMFRNLATELFRHEKIRTTDTKAKELKRVVDKIITLAKNGLEKGASNGGLSYKRRIFGYIRDKEVARKVFTEIAERYKQRPGGYSRIISLDYRKGDQTPISQIELVTEEYQPSTRTKTPRKSSLPSPPPPKKEEEKSPESAEAKEGVKEAKKEKKENPEAAQPQSNQLQNEEKQHEAEAKPAETNTPAQDEQPSDTDAGENGDEKKG
ncbi:MAG: 50S ribosomal protein L17 [Candidatus Mycalebacterium zealandia]|nr:MAG: 50S ribosomal protein L17 [Candidatus Mycalebacterium zealandia]